jgi:hypothetical protein
MGADVLGDICNVSLGGNKNQLGLTVIYMTILYSNFKKKKKKCS